MSSAYTRFTTLRTPQSEPIPGENQILNNAGGYAYQLDDLKAFERFLILGSEGGTFYVSEKKLTRDAAVRTIKVIEEHGTRAVDMIVQVSDSGRAPKNDPAIFALALAAAAKDKATRAYALAALPKVCRIPTHLFHFVTYVRQFRGMGRGLKTAIARWYQDLPVDKLAYECVKYQSRDGWSNADLLRLVRPKTVDSARNATYRWIVDGIGEVMLRHSSSQVPLIIRAFEKAKEHPESWGSIADLIRGANLSREMVPTEALNRPEVWDALLDKMPLTAMLRNLGNMSKCGLLAPLSDAAKTVCNRLEDGELLRKARIHPISILIAMKTYAQGHGMLGKGTWDAVGAVVDSLDTAFYKAFDYVEPTGQSFLLAIDVSGSMHAQIAGIPMDAAEGAAAMALACAKTERDYEIVCFDTQVKGHLKLTKNMRLIDIQRAIPRGGSTDCACAIKWAKDHKVNADNIVILTDNETWAGKFGHPSQVMRNYRNNINPRTKIINVGMVATNITVNDPNDALSLDVAGFDASVPAVIADFVKG